MMALGGDDLIGQRMRQLARERSELFDQEAELYDRCRPSYPDALITEVLGPDSTDLRVLDVGCGTGIASRLMAQRGATVMGVEPAAHMAEIARRGGIEVEISSFEEWDPVGRVFDRVTSAQAWHWLDMPVATTKAASVLEPGGRLCLFWRVGHHPGELADALAEAYEEIVPAGTPPPFVGYAGNRSTDFKAGFSSVVDAIARVDEFGAPDETWFPWTRSYRTDEWLDLLRSRSDHTALNPVVLGRLLESVGEAIDRFGGSFEMTLETVLFTATRL